MSQINTAQAFSGFLEAAFFTSRGHIDSQSWFSTPREEREMDGSVPSDVDAEDIHASSLAELAAIMNEMIVKAKPLLEEAVQCSEYDSEQLGRDLWFTYNGHGVGFWDREALCADDLGERISESIGRGEIHLFYGDHVDLGDAPYVHATTS